MNKQNKCPKKNQRRRPKPMGPNSRPDIPVGSAPAPITLESVHKRLKNMARYAWVEGPKMFPETPRCENDEPVRIIWGRIVHRSHMGAKVQRIKFWATRVIENDAEQVFNIIAEKAIRITQAP